MVFHVKREDSRLVVSLVGQDIARIAPRDFANEAVHALRDVFSRCGQTPMKISKRSGVSYAHVRAILMPCPSQMTVRSTSMGFVTFMRLLSAMGAKFVLVVNPE